MKFRIALAQLHIQFGDLEANVRRSTDLISEAARSASRMVMLPELWSCGYDLPHAPKHAAATPEIVRELHIQAKANQLIIGGSLPESTPQGIYNTFYWIDPDLPQPVVYRKIHLFCPMDENRYLIPGDHTQIVSAPWGETGLAVCYDLRFPELFRRYALDGSVAFALSAEWPVRRIPHWQTLLRARAIENLSFAFACNCVGPSGDAVFGGASAVISPWGETLVEASSTEEQLVWADIDTDQIERARGALTVFSDRRPDLY
jgi:predicted amidohydrolase